MQQFYKHIKIVLKSYQICIYIGIKIFDYRHYGMFQNCNYHHYHRFKLCIKIDNYVLCLPIMSIMPADYRVLENVYNSLKFLMRS